MATCRMFYQDNNKTTPAINPNHTKTQTQHKSSVINTDARTTEDTNKSLLIEDDERPSTSMQVDAISNVSKNTNGKARRDCDGGSSVDDSHAGGDVEEDVLTRNSGKRKSSDDGGCFDETDAGSQTRTNRRSLSSSFVTEEEDIEDDHDADQQNEEFAHNSRHQGQTGAKEGDSSLASTKPDAASTSCYNNSTYTRSPNRNCTKSDGEVAFNNSNNSNTLESDADDNRNPSHNFLTPSQLDASTKEELIRAYNQLQAFIDIRSNNYEDEIAQLKSSIEKYHGRQVDTSRRENILVMKLRTKEQETEEYVAQINELKAAVVPTVGVLKTSLIDPSVNFIMQNMKKELQETKKKLQDAQDDLVAWKFTPDSNTGKRLMAKCKMLYVENEELGKMINGGRVAKLENDLALQKTLTEDLRKAQTDMVELVHELDEDVEGMQSTIFYLQQQLRDRNKDGEPDSSANDLPSATDESDTAAKCSVSLSGLCSKCRTRMSDDMMRSRTNSRNLTTDSVETVADERIDDSTSTSTRTRSERETDKNTDGESQRTHLVNGLISSDPEDNSLSTKNNQSVLNTDNCSTVPVLDESMETDQSGDNDNRNAISTKKQLQLLQTMDVTNSSEREDGDDDEMDAQPIKKAKLFQPQLAEESDAIHVQAPDSNRTTTTATPTISAQLAKCLPDEVPSSSSLNGNE